MSTRSFRVSSTGAIAALGDDPPGCAHGRLDVGRGLPLGRRKARKRSAKSGARVSGRSAWPRPAGSRAGGARCRSMARTAGGVNRRRWADVDVRGPGGGDPAWSESASSASRHSTSSRSCEPPEGEASRRPRVDRLLHSTARLRTIAAGFTCLHLQARALEAQRRPASAQRRLLADSRRPIEAVVPVPNAAPRPPQDIRDFDRGVLQMGGDDRRRPHRGRQISPAPRLPPFPGSEMVNG